MDRPLYRIRRWQENFETFESRRLKTQTWVAVPNKHDGKSFRRLARLENAAAIYGAWQLVLQIASKMPVRGTLCDDDGPLSAADMEDKTGFPEEAFQEALTLLTSERIGWIEVVAEEEAQQLVAKLATSLFAGAPADSRTSPADSRTSPADSRTSPADSPHGTRLNGKIPAETPVFPAGSRTECGGSRTSRTRAGDLARPDQTRPDPAPPGGCACEAEVIARLAPLFNQNPDRPLSYAVQHALAAMMPVPLEELEIVAWFYGLDADGDPKAHELRTRHTKLRTLFEGWSDAAGVAREHAKKEGRVFGGEKNGAAEPEPEGWRDRLLERYPAAELPDHFADLPGSMKKIAGGGPASADYAGTREAAV